MCQSALVLVDCQNDFLSEKGILFDAVKENVKANNVIANVNKLLKIAHDKGMPVIFTSLSFAKGYPEIGDNAYGILATVKASGAFELGSWGADIYEGLNRHTSDIVVHKSTMCAFKTTSLKDILDEKGVTRLAFGGLVTDLCLETSIRSAYDYGFDVISLTDCMASLSQEAHENTVKENFPLFSKPMSHDEYIAAL